ncbi:hypothetical protein OD350_28760 (plasmid) [Clostridium beijerinckii]|uniref:hypothetical protein n=1 Tax=Clostridium beijerinckii TaxID=1520 RepID=UPI00222774D4|nr:hypothetical protein [Clostridium beijerinckii]UYZ39066.1 hypothetical protein OD350_28760 [Clostridium beijerinckii]
MDNMLPLKNNPKHYISEFICAIGIGLIWVSPAITSKYVALFINNINLKIETIYYAMIYSAIVIMGVSIFMKYLKINFIRVVISTVVSISHTFIFILPILFFFFCLFKVTFWLNYANNIALVIWIVMNLSMLPMFYIENK